MKKGDALRSLRLEAHLTQKQAAARAEVTRRYWIYVERGKKVPRINTLERMVEALEADPARLYRYLEGQAIGLATRRPSSLQIDRDTSGVSGHWEAVADLDRLTVENVRTAMEWLEERYVDLPQTSDILVLRAQAKIVQGISYCEDGPPPNPCGRALLEEARHLARRAGDATLDFEGAFRGLEQNRKHYAATHDKVAFKEASALANSVLEKDAPIFLKVGVLSQLSNLGEHAHNARLEEESLTQALELLPRMDDEDYLLVPSILWVDEPAHLRFSLGIRQIRSLALSGNRLSDPTVKKILSVDAALQARNRGMTRNIRDATLPLSVAQGLLRSEDPVRRGQGLLMRYRAVAAARRAGWLNQVNRADRVLKGRGSLPSSVRGRAEDPVCRSCEPSTTFNFNNQSGYQCSHCRKYIPLLE